MLWLLPSAGAATTRLIELDDLSTSGCGGDCSRVGWGACCVFRRVGRCDVLLKRRRKRQRKKEMIYEKER